MKRLNHDSASPLWQRTEHCPAGVQHAPHESPDGMAWCPGIGPGGAL